MFNRNSTNSLRNGSNNTNNTGNGNNTNNNAAPLNVDHYNTRIQILETRVRELNRQHDDQEEDIRRLKQAKADHQIRHAMRVSDLEHRLMVMKQQLWLATNPEAVAEAGASAPAPPLMHKPSVSMSSLFNETGGANSSSIRATLEAERTRRTELESQVASLRTQLNDERRRATTRDKDQRAEKAQLNDVIAARDATIATREAELRRVQAMLADQSTSSSQKTSRLERQVAEEAARRQQEKDAHTALVAEQTRAADDLRLQKNRESTARAAAERKMKLLQEEVARRGAQLEYYQQRLLRTAEFRLVKTPFDASEAGTPETVVASMAAPAEASQTVPESSTPTPMAPFEVAA
ncbi:hypothetical protein Sste5344_008374 [Sporothrix stenoceras]